VLIQPIDLKKVGINFTFPAFLIKNRKNKAGRKIFGFPALNFCESLPNLREYA
jgi:hypothetical protein